MPRRAQKCRVLAFVVVFATWIGVFPASAAWAANQNTARLSVSIDGRPLDGDVVLDAAAATRLVVGVENLGGSALDVDSVRLRGMVLGLTFFDYDTRVRTTVPARGTANWTVDLDLRDIAGRATGLVPIRVEIRDTDLDTVVARDGKAQVHGSLLSTYGLLGLGLLVLAGLLLAAAVLSPGASKLRGLRFVPAGCVLGLLVVFALSAMRLLAPSPPTDLAITLGMTLLAVVAGSRLHAPHASADAGADADAGAGADAGAA